MLECTMYGGTVPVTRATHVRKLLYLLRADGSDVTPGTALSNYLDMTETGCRYLQNIFENVK